MFGYSKDDEKEKENVEKMFNETDIDGGGYLDKEEIRGLTKKLEIDFTDDQLRTAMKEMDPDGHDDQWWHKEGWWSVGTDKKKLSEIGRGRDRESRRSQYQDSTE